MTGPGVRLPPRSFFHRSEAVVGPTAEVAEECRASRPAAGHPLAGRGAVPAPRGAGATCGSLLNGARVWPVPPPAPHATRRPHTAATMTRPDCRDRVELTSTRYRRWSLRWRKHFLRSWDTGDARSHRAARPHGRTSRGEVAPLPPAEAPILSRGGSCSPCRPSAPRLITDFVPIGAVRRGGLHRAVRAAQLLRRSNGPSRGKWRHMGTVLTETAGSWSGERPVGVSSRLPPLSSPAPIGRLLPQRWAALVEAAGIAAGAGGAARRWITVNRDRRGRSAAHPSRRNVPASPATSRTRAEPAVAELGACGVRRGR